MPPVGAATLTWPLEIPPVIALKPPKRRPTLEAALSGFCTTIRP